MDRLPRIRRKPKPPTIETSVDRTVADTPDIIQPRDSGNLGLVSQPPQKIGKMSALRNLRLRGPAKRARDSPPAELPTSPPPAVVAQDGMSPRRASRPNLQPEREPARNGQPPLPPPKMPGFLSLSVNDIDSKFYELTWAERTRLSYGVKNEAAGNIQWTCFKQTDAHERGFMDRYVNIKPWNQNRVKLQVPEGEFDYVNASPVVLKSSDPSKAPLRYIAMQGPTEPSFNYVWRMIAEQIESPAVIVQLTNMFEGGAVKCDQYFPRDEGNCWALNQNDIWRDGWRALLTYDSLEDLAGGAIEKRKLLLHVDGEVEPKIIWHFLYKKWPDFGVPNLEDLDSFYELMRLSRKHSSPTTPRIIHCSAGVGRTGTFICLEHLIRELHLGALSQYDMPREQPDLVYHTVDLLRQQRRSMVQADIQYTFIYQVMRKLWQDKYGTRDEDASREPAAKRLEVADPFTGQASLSSPSNGPGPDVGAARS